jgi:two-component system nitrogen regulation response regulator NtrX
LVVDDEPVIVATLGAILEQHGLEVVTASSSHDAKDKLVSDGGFDLVVTDLTMETELAGYDVLAAACRQQNRPPVLIVTGHPELATDWREHGASALLPKPAAVPELLQIVDTLLDGCISKDMRAS